MPKRWVPLLTWTLTARRYSDEAPPALGAPQDLAPGIDLGDLKTFIHLREAIVAWVSELWRRDNPPPKKRPYRWEDALELRLFRTFKGSCTTRVYGLVADAPDQGLLFPDHPHSPDGRDLSHYLPRASDWVALTLNYVSSGTRPPFAVPEFATTAVDQLSRSIRTGDKLTIKAVEPEPDSGPELQPVAKAAIEAQARPYVHRPNYHAPVP